MNKGFLLLIVFSLFFISFGCVDGPGSLPYTTGQFISRSTDLNYAVFMMGGYDGNCLGIDGNKITIVQCKVYGELNGIDTSVTIPVKDVYYLFDDLNAGLLNGFVFDDLHLIAVHRGIYHVITQWSFSGGVNNEYHLSLFINNVHERKCHSERVLGTGGDVGSASYTCLIELNEGDIITPVVENFTAGNNAIIHDFQLVINKVG